MTNARLVLLRAAIGMHWLQKHCSIDYLTEELSDVYIDNEISSPRPSHSC